MVPSLQICVQPRVSVLLSAICILCACTLETANATTIRGSEENLRCVYENRLALSLDGLIDPVIVYIEGCNAQFAGETAVDKTHGGAGKPELDIVPGTPPPEEWAQIPIAEIDRIPCKIREARGRDPDAEVFELDLSTSCESGSQ